MKPFAPQHSSPRRSARAHCATQKQSGESAPPTSREAGSDPAGVRATAQWLVKARRGDRQAFCRLWEAHAHVAHAMLLSMMPAHSAEDVLQEVAMAAWTNLEQLEDAHKFCSWLCAIARNRGLNALKSKDRAARTNVELEGLSGRAPQGAPLSSVELDADHVLAIMRRLPECYREPLTLRLVGGLSGPEIARHLRMTPGSVRVNLCRGLKLLRRRLDCI